MLENLTGNVLDVGSGTGVNFQYFNSEVNILAVEPSLPMLEKSKPKILNKNIQLINKGINDVSLNEIIKEQSLDAVICTLVLCTIPNPEFAIENFKKWLKPNGKLIILEHIHSDNIIRAKIETFVNPVWKKIGDGCNLTRNTDKLLTEKGFVSENSSYFSLGIRIHKGIYQLV